MQVGDTVPVMIAGDVVCQAKIVSMEEGVATLIVPATQVRMSYVTQLTSDKPAAPEPSKQVIIDDVVRNAPVAGEVESAAPVQTTNVEVPAETANDSISGPVETGAVETPQGEATQTELKAPEAPASDA